MVHRDRFNLNGLAGILTCGKTGIGAALSHSPTLHGREKYVFISFTHIAIDSAGNIGHICRRGRHTTSGACGALQAALRKSQSTPIEELKRELGSHDADDPEFSMLMGRLAMHMEQDKMAGMDLVDITKLADKCITSDLEDLISKTIDPEKADYGLICGIHVHSWPEQGVNSGEPLLEFAWVSTQYVVVNGQRRELQMESIPSFTPRQLLLLNFAARANLTAFNADGLSGDDSGGACMGRAMHTKSMKYSSALQFSTSTDFLKEGDETFPRS